MSAHEPQATAPAFFDSLPYYDNDLELYPILRERVQHELAMETQKVQQGQGDRLHPLVPADIELFKVNSKPFSNRFCISESSQDRPVLSEELARVEARKPLNAIDTTRYALPVPSENATEEDWRSALDNARAQLEHQRIRYARSQLLRRIYALKDTLDTTTLHCYSSMAITLGGYTITC